MSFIGIGISTSSILANIFSPDKLWTPSAPGFWADIDAPDAVVRNTQPTLTNTAFVGTTGWLAARSTLSAVSAAPFSGNALRVTSTGVSPAGYQTPIIVGNRYLAHVWCRGDGTRVPSIGGQFLSEYATGTSSTDWQYIEGYRTADTIYFALYHNGNTVGTADFWSPAVENYSIASITCKGSLGNLAQSTATAMPWETALGSRKSIYSDTGDGLILGTDKATQRHFHDGYGATLSCVFKSSLADNNFLFSSSGNSDQVGMFVKVSTTGYVSASITNGSGTYVFAASSAAGVIAPNVTSLIVTRHNVSGLEIYVDGTLVASDYVIAGVHSTGDAYSLMCANSYVGLTYPSEQVADCYSVAKYVSDFELAQLQVFFASRHGITLS